MKLQDLLSEKREAILAIAIEQMRGILQTAEPAPTDQQVAMMLEERRLEKYL